MDITKAQQKILHFSISLYFNQPFLPLVNEPVSMPISAMISSMRAIFSRVDSPGGSAIYSLQLLGALKEMAPCCQRETGQQQFFSET